MNSPERYWYASLTGDLVCGYCDKMHQVRQGQTFSPGPMLCSHCAKSPELTFDVLRLADERAVHAYPFGRPREDGFKWKGD